MFSIYKKKIQTGGLRSFRQLFHQQGTSGGADYEAYALGWCITSLLLKSYKVQTVNFIKKIKISSELDGPVIPKGVMTKEEVEELQQKLNGAKKQREKILEDYFLECFKMDIDKFGETIYSQIKQNPAMLEKL